MSELSTKIKYFYHSKSNPADFEFNKLILKKQAPILNDFEKTALILKDFEWIFKKPVTIMTQFGIPNSGLYLTFIFPPPQLCLRTKNKPIIR